MHCHGRDKTGVGSVAHCAVVTDWNVARLNLPGIWWQFQHQLRRSCNGSVRADARAAFLCSRELRWEASREKMAPAQLQGKRETATLKAFSVI